MEKVQEQEIVTPIPSRKELKQWSQGQEDPHHGLQQYF